MTNPDFSSDNIAAAAPEILHAIAAANHGAAHSYGDDPLTRRLTALARDVFETDCAIYPVATGTAANALALATLAPPFGGVFCHADAHIEKDECGAPEFFTAGAKLLTIPGAHGRITPAALAAAHDAATARGVHNVRPAAISLSQATEWGTVYTPAQIRAIADVADANNLALHIDGARFANAIVHLNCTPAEATWKAGAKILSLGATKNGAVAAEAVVLFDQSLAEEFEYRRKRAGQLYSKMRFFSAQLVAYLEHDNWRRYAAAANRAAARLAAGLQTIPGVGLAAPVEANEIFVALPEPAAAALEAAGFGFYRWPAPPGLDNTVIRLVAAWNTTDEDVDHLLAALHAA
jgi:threonine aldolase